MVDSNTTQAEAIIGTFAALSSSTFPYPSGATPLMASSGNVANASAAATLAGAAAKTTYITGFAVTGTGATAVSIKTVTVAGPSTTLSYTYTFVAGATTANQPLIVSFPVAIPAAAVNTDIVVTCAASGAGGTNNTVSAYGYRV